MQIGIATNWASINGGRSHSIATQSDGSLWAWGNNGRGQLGDGTVSLNNVSPTSIACPSACTLTTGTFTISACNSYTWAAKGNKVYTASNNTDTIHLKNAGGCDSLVTLNLTISTATHNVSTQTATNTYTWNGQNYTASGTYTYSYNNANGCASVDTLKLTVNAQTTGCSFKAISAGRYNNTAIKTDGSLWAWGDNSGGQLGDGTTNQRLSPVQIGTATNWASIGEGGVHSIALKTDGTLWAWGANTYGQLGYGTTANSNSPVQIGTATNWVSISAGENHNMAIKTDGTLWAWGSNVFGQLGDGTTANSNSPVQIGTATNWASIDAGNYHTIAIKTDGSLWAWGRGNEGQLGDGSYISKNSPVQIGNATNWASISLGTYHSIATQTNGSLWAWGDNGGGQLGNSSSLGGYYCSPVQIGNATNWASISSGEFHSIGIKTNGSLWAWGYNFYGQLGDSSDHNIKTSPVQIGTSTWSSIGAGGYHTIAIKTNGSLWAWGWNNQGRLGDGTTFDENSPVQIGCASCTPTTGTFTISACNSYTWAAKGNKVYTASNNTDTIHLKNAGGCDSLVTLNLTVVSSLPAITGTSSACAGSTTTLSNAISGGVWFTQATSQATINAATGLVTAKNAGTITIQYSKTGCGSVTKSFTVNPIPVVPTITYAPGTPNPQVGAPTGGFCVGKKFRVVATPNIPAGVWSATGFASFTGYDTVNVNAVGAGSIKYTYTSAAGCSNSRTMNGNGYTCAARGVSVSGEGLVVSGDFTMYPNPAKGSINLNVETLIGAGSIVVTDLYGKTVKIQPLSMGTNTVDIANLSKGMYFVSTITNEGKTTKKLIVE